MNALCFCANIFIREDNRVVFERVRIMCSISWEIVERKQLNCCLLYNWMKCLKIDWIGSFPTNNCEYTIYVYNFIRITNNLNNISTDNLLISSVVCCISRAIVQLSFGRNNKTEILYIHQNPSTKPIEIEHQMNKSLTCYHCNRVWNCYTFFFLLPENVFETHRCSVNRCVHTTRRQTLTARWTKDRKKTKKIRFVFSFVWIRTISKPMAVAVHMFVYICIFVLVLFFAKLSVCLGFVICFVLSLCLRASNRFRSTHVFVFFLPTRSLCWCVCENSFRSTQLRFVFLEA